MSSRYPTHETFGERQKRSAKEARNHRNLNLKVLGAAAAGVTLAIVGIGEIPVKDPAKIAAAQATELQTDIAGGKTVKVLEDGTAIMQLEDGKFMKVTNPVINKAGYVAEKNSQTGELGVYYSDHDSDVGDMNAAKITYTEHGKTISKDQAFEDAQPVVLNTSGSTTGNAVDVSVSAAPGQHFNQPIAVGVPEHTVTITKVVPDSPETNG